MPLFFGIIVTVVIAALAFAVFSVWGFFIVIPALLLLGGYLLLARKGGGRAGTIEVARKEPTGTVRKARGDADTANERVGQA